MIEVMRKMREDRGGAIQSEDQLEYAYAALVRFMRNHKLVRHVIGCEYATDCVCCRCQC